jgi:hypothetical protein
VLCLDFRVDGQAHPAEFVLDAAHGDSTDTHDTNSPADLTGRCV